jgi:hypothetical protein
MLNLVINFIKDFLDVRTEGEGNMKAVCYLEYALRIFKDFVKFSKRIRTCYKLCGFKEYMRHLYVVNAKNGTIQIVEEEIGKDYEEQKKEMINYINIFSLLDVQSSQEQTSEKKEIDADVRPVVEEITPERSIPEWN